MAGDSLRVLISPQRQRDAADALGDPTLLEWSIPRSSAGVTDIALIIVGRDLEMKTRQPVAPHDALPNGAVGVAAHYGAQRRAGMDRILDDNRAIDDYSRA
jgi:hypothetical protein